jgi:4-amino-4-deoxy-L-arabinose transferase-like glycosyltransferase
LHVREPAITALGDRRHLALAAILLLALLVRVVIVAADGSYEPANDAFEYDYYAQSVAAGEGYPRSGYLRQGGPTAIRGPGYPYLLGGAYAIADDSKTVGRLLGVALGVLTVLLVYLIAKRIWGRRVGLLAAALTAVFPPLALLSRELLSETLFIPLELGALLCVLNFRRSGGGLRWAAAAGALCGLALLTRNTGLALLLCVPLGVLVARPKLSPRSLGAPLVVLGVAALVVAPWTVRNAVQFGRFVPVTTSAGITTAGVYNEASFRDSETHGAWRDPQIVPRFTPLFVTPGIDEGAVDASLRREARDFAWHHPGYVAEVLAWNLVRMFELTGGSVVDAHGRPVDDRGIGSATPAAERIGIFAAVLLALCGVIAIARSRLTAPSRPGKRLAIPTGPLFLWSVPILILLMTAPINGLPRDRLPADPFLLILAAIGLAWLGERISGLARRAA